MAISLSTNKGMADRQAARLRRQARGRKKIAGTADRPRLVVFRSSRHISAQVIDDTVGTTLASASSLELRSAAGDKSAKAKEVGKLIAERGQQAGGLGLRCPACHTGCSTRRPWR